MGLADAYAAPIREVLDKFGPGELSGPSGAWRAAGAGLGSAAHEQVDALARAQSGWQGHTAELALGQARSLATATETLQQNAAAVAGIVESAGAAVRTGRAQVQQILDGFLALAEPLLSITPVPPLTAAVLAGRAAMDALEAADVLAKVQTELAGESHALAGLPTVAPAPLGGDPSSAEGAPPAATTPQQSTFSSPPAETGAVRADGARATSGSGGASGDGPAVSHSGGSRGGSPSGPALHPAVPPQPGTGVDVSLPGGHGTVQAPNPQAAAAVRNALTQLGVPYEWGGTTPGQGLDCSGLTSWAYGQAGVQIPRLAADQAIGATVAPDALLPGDLVVWSGHVAMVIGDGQMVEAGDPVQISPVRTSNQGDAFLGFHRPTG